MIVGAGSGPHLEREQRFRRRFDWCNPLRQHGWKIVKVLRATILVDHSATLLSRDQWHSIELNDTDWTLAKQILNRAKGKIVGGTVWHKR